MDRYLTIIQESYSSYFSFLISEITTPNSHNYFYWLIGISLLVWMLEIAFPWRKKQSYIRKDFWLDGWYLFFNFFIFTLILYNALSNVVVTLFNDLLSNIGLNTIVGIPIGDLPKWIQLLILFIVVDFISWNTHRLLHRSSLLWRFHSVHHSVKEMGFAAHFRFHWMETIVYRLIQFIPISIIGFGAVDFFIVHMFTVLVGHINHANVGWSYGPFKYVFNNPKMHIWHHSKHLPVDRRNGVNFGISLSIWDYLFKTTYIPKDGCEIELGFPGDAGYPGTFVTQSIHPFKSGDSHV